MIIYANVMVHWDACCFPVMLGYLGNSVVIPFPIKLRPFFSRWSCEWKWLIMVSYHNGTGELELKTISSFAVCYVIYVWHAHVLLYLFSLVLYLFCSCFDMKWINMSLMLHMMLFSIGEIFENPFCIRCQVILFVRRKGVGYLVLYFMLHYRILVWEREKYLSHAFLVILWYGRDVFLKKAAFSEW